MDPVRIICRAKDQGRVFMQVVRNKVQNCRLSVDRLTASLFNQKGDGHRCLGQAQAAAFIPPAPVFGIEEAPAKQQDPVQFARGGRQPAHVEIAAAWAIRTGTRLRTKACNSVRQWRSFYGLGPLSLPDRNSQIRPGDAEPGPRWQDSHQAAGPH